MTEVENVRDAVVQIQIGSRTYSAIRNPRCGVCMHPARFLIEEKILLNYSNPAVAKMISNRFDHKLDGTEEEWPNISPAQVRNHRINNHCPVEAWSELANQRAQQLGIKLEETDGQFVDHVIVQHAVMARGLEMLNRGEINPDVKDLLTASKFVGEYEKSQAGGASEEQWQDFMQIYFSVVQRVVSGEQWMKIRTEIQNHPAMLAIQQQRQAIDVEEVEA